MGFSMFPQPCCPRSHLPYRKTKEIGQIGNTVCFLHCCLGFSISGNRTWLKSNWVTVQGCVFLIAGVTGHPVDFCSDHVPSILHGLTDLILMGPHEKALLSSFSGGGKVRKVSSVSEPSRGRWGFCVMWQQEESSGFMSGDLNSSLTDPEDGLMR